MCYRNTFQFTKLKWSIHPISFRIGFRVIKYNWMQEIWTMKDGLASRCYTISSQSLWKVSIWKSKVDVNTVLTWYIGKGHLKWWSELSCCWYKIWKLQCSIYRSANKTVQYLQWLAQEEYFEFWTPDTYCSMKMFFALFINCIYICCKCFLKMFSVQTFSDTLTFLKRKHFYRNVFGGPLGCLYTPY